MLENVRFLKEGNTLDTKWCLRHSELKKPAVLSEEDSKENIVACQ